MNFELKSELLNEEPRLCNQAVELNACINAHGLYDSFQFVLRLSPVVHKKISEIKSGIISTNELDLDQAQAYSTYLHETIHWWQHIGSTAGLMQSLIYPAQFYMNLTELKEFLEKVGAYKSINGWILKNPRYECEESLATGNTIINNFYDTEFFRLLMRSPSLTKEIIKSPFFESQGHSFVIAYSNILSLLGGTLNLEIVNDILPNPDNLVTYYLEKKEQKLIGYNYQSTVEIPLLGSVAIYEGQARFSQMQFLAAYSGFSLKLSHFGQRGMLDGVYIEAFDFFCESIKLNNYPEGLDDVVIGLFLLVCDISINPGMGFPFEPNYERNIVKDADPGIRFTYIVKAISQNVEKYLSLLKKFSKEEYFQVTSMICEELGYHTMEAILQKVVGWCNRNTKISDLMKELDSFEFNPLNLPVRVLFSHYLQFSRDKLENPEFFCWPGLHLVVSEGHERSLELWNRNMALFGDKPDEDGIYLATLPGKDQKKVKETFESFYANNVIFNFSRQWICQNGEFNFDHKWLSSKGSREDYKDFVDRHFLKVFNKGLGEFNIL